MLVGQPEFALRHEGVNLEVIDALFAQLPPQDLLARLNAAPIRRACHLWEWLTGQELPAEALPAGGYADLFPAADYVTAGQSAKDRKFRVRNTAGNGRFLPNRATRGAAEHAFVARTPRQGPRDPGVRDGPVAP